MCFNFLDSLNVIIYFFFFLFSIYIYFNIISVNFCSHSRKLQMSDQTHLFFLPLLPQTRTLETAVARLMFGTMAPSEIRLFRSMKYGLAGTWFREVEEVQKWVHY